MLSTSTLPPRGFMNVNKSSRSLFPALNVFTRCVKGKTYTSVSTFQTVYTRAHFYETFQGILKKIIKATCQTMNLYSLIEVLKRYVTQQNASLVCQGANSTPLPHTGELRLSDPGSHGQCSYTRACSPVGPIGHRHSGPGSDGQYL